MQAKFSEASFPRTLKASALVFALSLMLGAGATQALVAEGSPSLFKPVPLSGTRFVDTRRLPSLDDHGNPVRPFYAVTAAAPRLASAE